MTLVGALCLAGPAMATTVVTTCGTDNAAGGTNFVAAVAAGGDIAIRCQTGGNTIQFTRMHNLVTGITIDGEGKVTLAGMGSGMMFTVKPLTTLTLKGLTIRNPAAPGSDPRTYAGIVYQPDNKVSIVLQDVNVIDTPLPFLVEQLSAHGGTFARNGSSDSRTLGAINAAQIDLTNVSFDDNTGRPFLSMLFQEFGIVPIRGRVSDCVFRGNKAPALWRGGTLLILGSLFENNGGAPAAFYNSPTYDLVSSRVGFDSGEGLRWAGALELASTSATIDHSIFRGNTGAMGGALYLQDAQVAIQASQLDDNRADAGGAIAIVQTGKSPTARLSLSEVKLRRNQARNDGGALFGNGAIEGKVMLISGNRAGRNGGAIAGIASSSAEGSPTVRSSLVGLLRAARQIPSKLVLRQSFVLDNQSNGPVIDGEEGEVQFGNLLAARNKSGAAAAVIRGSRITLVNTTLADNDAAAIGGVGVRLINTIMANNSHGNCPAGDLGIQGNSLEYPGNSCAGFIKNSPSLDSRFSPGTRSLAHSGGAVSTCLYDSLVQGLDIYGDPRGLATCAIGAVEPSSVRDVAGFLPSDWVRYGIPLWVIYGAPALLLVAFIVGLLRGLINRKSRQT